MSATKLPHIERLNRDLSALYELIRAQGREIDTLKAEISKLKQPNGNRQRRTPSGN